MSENIEKTPPTEEQKDKGAQQARNNPRTTQKRDATGKFVPKDADKPGFFQRTFTNKVLTVAEKTGLIVSFTTLALFSIAKFGTSVGFLAKLALILTPYATPLLIAGAVGSAVWATTGAVMLNRKIAENAEHQTEVDIENIRQKAEAATS